MDLDEKTQEGPASDQEDVHGGGGEEEFHHRLTMDESETNYRPQRL